jgi:hypothetical protein
VFYRPFSIVGFINYHSVEKEIAETLDHLMPEIADFSIEYYERSGVRDTRHVFFVIHFPGFEHPDTFKIQADNFIANHDDSSFLSGDLQTFKDVLDQDLKRLVIDFGSS